MCFRDTVTDFVGEVFRSVVVVGFFRGAAVAGDEDDFQVLLPGEFLPVRDGGFDAGAAGAAARGSEFDIDPFATERGDEIIENVRPFAGRKIITVVLFREEFVQGCLIAGFQVR